MKLTTKILVIIFSTIILYVIGSLLYFNSFAEVTPAPLVKETVKKTVDLTGVRHLKFGRGLWIVDVTQSDSNYAKIEGADNLINNFTIIEIVDDTLIVDVDEKFEYDNTWQNYIHINHNEIKSITALHNTHLFFSSVLSDTLKTYICHLSSMNIKNGNISFLKIEGSDYANILFENCTIDNLSFRLKNKSIITGRNSDIDFSGECLDSSSYYVRDRRGNEQIIISETLINRRNMQDEFLPGLKMLEYRNNIMSTAKKLYKLGERYKPPPYSADTELVYFPLLVSTKIRMYEYYMGGEFFSIPASNVYFVFSNGLLTHFSFSIYSDNDNTLLYAELLDTLTQLYGEPSNCIENNNNVLDINNCWRLTTARSFIIKLQARLGYITYKVSQEHSNFVINMDDNEFFEKYLRRIRYVRMYNWPRIKREIFDKVF